MKILHVGNPSGIASIMANMCTKLGHESVVITDDVEEWDHGEYYGNLATCSSSGILKKIIIHTEQNYDHIVYHDRYDIASDLDYLHIPSSFMFHDNMLRLDPDMYMHVDNLESIDNLFVISQDLLKYAHTAILLPTPVDLDLFKAYNSEDRLEMAVCLVRKCYIRNANEITKDLDPMVLVTDKMDNRKRYRDMPEFLNGFKYYHDIKFQATDPPMVLPEFTQTGLQALACGVAVCNNGIWFYKFPMVHSDELVCKEFISVLLE